MIIKVVLLVAVGMLGACPRSMAQASFVLQNLGLHAPVLNWDGSLLWGPEWRLELYGGATPDSLSPTVQFYTEERYITSLRGPGFFMARPPGGDLVVPAVRDNGWAWLQVKVWDVGLGATYEEASGRGLGGYGESSLIYAIGGAPSAHLPSVPGQLIGLQSFRVLKEVPEPCTWGCLGLGLAGLWWRQRRS
jgi:hypothetical protein